MKPMSHARIAGLVGGLIMTAATTTVTGTETLSLLVPTRDGLKLRTNVWLPGKGKYPLVLSRAYSTSFNGNRSRFNAAGYACAGQETRNNGGSDGTRFIFDGRDGYDAIEWLAKQPWCNGQVAMFGKSYWGITQWLAAAERPPSLKAIIPQNHGIAWRWGYRARGAITLAMTANGRALKSGAQPNWDWYMQLPLIDLDLKGVGKENQLWNDYVSHSQYDEYWQAISVAGVNDEKFKKVRIPVFLMGGWWDYYPGEAFYAFARLRKTNATPEIRIAISATEHLDKSPPGRKFAGGTKDESGLAIRWLDHVLKGIDNGIKDEPPIKVFTMGSNKWKSYDQWPPATAKLTKFYFRSPDGSRRGTVSTTPPENEPPSTYQYDPADPVPTLGGNHSYCCSPHPLVPVGSYDHGDHEKRNDVLVFTSEPMTEDTEVTGPIQIKLYAASSAKDTDWTAVLLDVYPDGTPYNLTMGILRARFREDLYGTPKLLTPGQIYEYTLDLMPTSNVFLKGHQIRVHLSSSNFPLWDRNTNTGGSIATETKTIVATQTIHHSAQYPSHILLPVVGGFSGGDPGPKAALELQTPGSGKTWPVGSSQEIAWTSQGTIDEVKIEISRDGGSSWETLAGATPNDGSFFWTVSGEPSSVTSLRISDASDPAVSDSTGPFTIEGQDAQAPAIALTALGIGGMVDDPGVSQILLGGKAVPLTGGIFLGQVSVGSSSATVPIEATDARGNTARRTIRLEP